MRLSIIGCGYVGLTTGACLAEMGNEIIFMDKDVEKLEKLKKFEVPIYEPGLRELLLKNKNKISFTSELEKAIRDVIFLCLPTYSTISGEADVSIIFDVAKNLARMVEGEKIIVVKSTVPIGTCEKLKHIFENKAEIVSNPEFLREGQAIFDFMNPDRIVIGVESEKAKKNNGRNLQ